MKSSISLALLVGGVILMIFGIIEYDSTTSDISRFFNGSASDKSIWLSVTGIVATVAGITGFSRKPKFR